MGTHIPNPIIGTHSADRPTFSTSRSPSLHLLSRVLDLPDIPRLLAALGSVQLTRPMPPTDLDEHRDGGVESLWRMHPAAGRDAPRSPWSSETC